MILQFYIDFKILLFHKTDVDVLYILVFSVKSFYKLYSKPDNNLEISVGF